MLGRPPNCTNRTCNITCGSRVQYFSSLVPAPDFRTPIGQQRFFAQFCSLRLCRRVASSRPMTIKDWRERAAPARNEGFYFLGCAHTVPVSIQPTASVAADAGVGRLGRSVARNIETKARVSDLPRVRAEVASLASTPPKVFVKTDTFFVVPRGRLKLRQSSDRSGELISYERADQAWSCRSRRVGSTGCVAEGRRRYRMRWVNLISC